MLVRVLGAPAIRGASGLVLLRGRRQAALLGLLTLDLGRPISRSRLEEELWGDVAVSDAALRVVVNRVRQHFADAGVPDLIRGERSGYRLDCAPGDVDATRLGAVAAEVADAERRGDDEALVRGGEAAAGLWAGDPFVAAARQPDPEDQRRSDDLRSKIAELDRAIDGYRRVIREQPDTAGTVGRWIAECMQERKRLEYALTGGTTTSRLTAEDIKALVAGLHDICATIAQASPADREVVYAELGIHLTYHADGRVEAESRPV